MTPDQWAAISDDEFIEKAQRRVTRFSPDRYMSQKQADDRAARDIQRSAIVSAWVRVIHGADAKEELLFLRKQCDMLDSIRGNPLPERAYAINTTFVGKAEVYQDHSPQTVE